MKLGKRRLASKARLQLDMILRGTTRTVLQTNPANNFYSVGNIEEPHFGGTRKTPAQAYKLPRFEPTAKENKKSRNGKNLDPKRKIRRGGRSPFILLKRR